MSYSFMSNINYKSTSTFTSPDEYYQTVGVFSTTSSSETPENGVIIFNDTDNEIQRKAKFLMIRSGADNDFIIQLSPSNYCVHIPAGELWSVDSIDEINKLYIRNIFETIVDSETNIVSTTSTTTGKLQWMIGYK